MSDTTKVVILLMLAVLIGLPLAGQLMKSAPGSATVDEASVSQGPQPPRQAWRQSPQPRPQGRPNPGPRGRRGRGRQAGRQPPMLNAKNLVNSVWELEGARVTLLSGGKLKATHPAVPFPINGTWSVRGSTLTVSAMGETQTAQIVGHDVVASGTSIRRIR